MAAPTSHRGRFIAFIAAMLFAAVVLSSDWARASMRSIFDSADELIAAHPQSGAVIFVALSALSAMLAFFSSAILVPVAIYALGDRTTFTLLWLGWLIGGAAAYTVGKYVGHGVVEWIVGKDKLSQYEQQLTSEATFGRVLLFHFLVPSEMPGYVLGLIGYPFRRYLLVLAIAEIPFAAGAIYLGSSFVEGDVRTFVLLAGGAILLSILTAAWFFRRTASV